MKTTEIKDDLIYNILNALEEIKRSKLQDVTDKIDNARHTICGLIINSFDAIPDKQVELSQAQLQVLQEWVLENNITSVVLKNSTGYAGDGLYACSSRNPWGGSICLSKEPK